MHMRGFFLFERRSDDVLWRPTRRTEERQTKNKLSSRGGAVPNNACLSGRSWLAKEF
jgi:hypothetical protein